MRYQIALPDSWYEKAAQRGPAREALRQDVSADVCVIGAGFAGLTAALELARAGKSVVLLEGARVAAGASGRNGGFVSNGFALGMDGVAQRVGQDAARRLYDLSRKGTEYVRAQIAAHEPSVKMGDGWRVSVRHEDKGGLRDYGAQLMASYGEAVEYSPVTETRRVLVSERYFDSLYFPHAFHIHPVRYGLLLARLAEAAGARIYENTRALSVSRDGVHFRIKTESGTVKAEHVVHCVSSLDTGIHKASGRAILPVATYVAVTEPLKQDAIRTSSAISDPRRAGDYYRLVDEGRILWGGRITTRLSEPRHLAEEMKGDMLSTYPQLGNPRIDFAWGGLMGYALHKMPLIGRDAEGQWFATAFGGHGLNTTAMAGGLIAKAIASGDDEYRRFAPFAPQWAFGQLGRLGVQGSYWLMQWQDRRDEQRNR